MTTLFDVTGRMRKYAMEIALTNPKISGVIMEFAEELEAEVITEEELFEKPLTSDEDVEYDIMMGTAEDDEAFAEKYLSEDDDETDS